MGKISQVAAKYIINASIEVEGVVDRPDVIGAIFGQTEGLLGADLELRELQRSGRIGRIEVNLQTKGGKTQGEILIPSSLDKAETSIVGAALEIIQRIGPCNSKVNVNKIEDVRVSKRNTVIERAKELLQNMMDDVIPDSQVMAVILVPDDIPAAQSGLVKTIDKLLLLPAQLLKTRYLVPEYPDIGKLFSLELEVPCLTNIDSSIISLLTGSEKYG